MNIVNSYIASIATYKPIQGLPASTTIKWYIGHRISAGDNVMPREALENKELLTKEYLKWCQKNLGITPKKGTWKAGKKTRQGIEEINAHNQVDDIISSRLIEMF